MKTWIYTITEPRNDWETGDEAEFWTAARYDDTGAIIIRKDRAPAGEPSWQAGDRALAFDAASQRFFAALTVLVGATWRDGEDGEDGAYWTGMRLDKVNYYGPFVADTGRPSPKAPVRKSTRARSARWRNSSPPTGPARPLGWR